MVTSYDAEVVYRMDFTKPKSSGAILMLTLLIYIIQHEKLYTPSLFPNGVSPNGDEVVRGRE